MKINNDSSDTRLSKSNAKLIRFITSIFSYLFILASSTMIIYFANRRGNPVELKILYYTALVLNIAQIILVLSKFVIQQAGVFSRILYKIENILAIIWETVIAAEFAFSCILFKAFRLDSLLIVLMQGLAILLMLLYSRKIDYSVNKKHNQKSQKNGDVTLHNPSVLRGRELSKSILYVFTCLCVFILELTVLTIPKLPPKIDDIFSDTRVLEYEYYKNVLGYEDGYYVSDIYYGTNDKIVIPLTYNDIPVVGILEDSITDEGIINSIQIGEFDSTGVLKSNVKIIESEAINLNRIVELSLPESIEKIEKNAIFGKKIQTINIYFENSFTFDCFNTENLSTINIKNTNSVVEADYKNFNVEVKVPTNLYNRYRTKFFDNRNVFNLINDEDYIVIDFETNSNVYLDSKILDKNDAKLNITSLKNAGVETSSLINDTVLYNNDNYTCDGFQSKDGYAFRGWYRDENYTLECVFSDTHDISFNEDTTVYARWEEIKTIELDWSNYYPYNEKTTIIKYVASTDINESIIFPKLKMYGGNVEREGFKNLKWKLGNEYVEKTLDLANLSNKNIRLTAEWELETPKVTYETKANNTVYNGSNLTFTFDEDQIINYVASYSHESENVTITCKWKKQNADGDYTVLRQINTTNKDIFNYSLRNVADSGVYKLEIIAKANTGEQSTITHGYNININKKDIDVSLYGVMQPVTRVYNGNNQELKYNFVLPSNIKVSENYEVDGYYSTVAPVNASNEAYSVRYVFENISEDRDNYNVAYLYSYITITPKPVTAIWEQTESIWNNNFELIYDGSHHILTPIVDGICGTDKVSFVMKNSSEKDVGTYISTIIGVTNTNYKLDTFNTEQSHVWKILPKELTTSWGITESEYTGDNISFDFYIEGIVPVDVHNVSADDFVCITDCNDEAYTYNNGVLSFYAKDAGDYSVLLESFDNDNYIFKSNIKTLKITKSILSTSWSNTSIVYTGEKQFSKLTISGFKLGDEKRYTNDLINNYFVLQSECNYEILSQVNGKLEIAFYTKDVGTYSAKLEKIVNDNYLVSATSSYIIVSPKELTGSWINASLEYNGYEQGRIYRISNLAKEDVEKLSVDDFSIDFDGERYDLKPNVNAGYVDLCFYGKDAKTYNISINAFDTVNHNGNFTFSNKVKYSFVIKPRLLDVTWEEPSYVYDDSEKVIKVSKINNICANDDVDLLYTNNKAINAGTYTANIYSTNSNYITDSSHNKEWTIEKKQLTVLYEIVDKENKFLSKNSVIYDGNYKYFKLKYSGFEGDDLTTITTNNFNYSFNYSNISETGSGIEGNYYVSKFRAIDSKSYTITLTSHYLENYEVSIVRSFTILQKKANIEWNYTLPFIYSKTTCVVTPSVTNQCTRDDTGEKDLVSVNVSGNTGINAGTYTAVISSLSNNNYYVEDSVKEFNWTINPKVLKLSWNNPSLVFNAEHQQRYATATNLCTNDSVSFNYLYAKMNNVTGVYSDYSSTLTIDKGNYKTKVSSIFGMDANNYILASDIQESEYSIEARKLTASIVGTTYTYSGDSRSLITLTFSNFPTSTEASKFTVNNIDYQANVLMSKNNYSYTSCSFDFCATDAGIYNAVINGCINNDNYIFDVCSATGVITKKVIEVSWPTATYTYDGTAKSFIASINNIASGDSIEITYSYSGSSLLGDKITSNSMSDAGTYTVSIVSIDNDNYTIDEATNLSKIFTITPKALTVNYSGVSFTYDGDYQGMSLTISGYASKDKSLFASNPFVYTHSGCKAEYNSTNTTLNLYAVDAGTYNVKVSDLTNSFSNSNYILSSEISSSYVINPKTIPVTLSSTSLIYNGYVQTITPLISSTSMYTNVLTGKKDSVELSYSGNTAKNVGTYSVIINSMTGEDAKNYKLSSTTLNWYINKKNLTLTWDSLTTFTYNGQEQTVKLKISGFVGQDAKDKEILDFTTPTTSSYVSISEISKTSDSVILSFTKIDAGTYICKLNSISDLSNYSYSLSSCSFVIEKKVVQLTWDCLTTFTYDGTSHSIGCVVSNACLRSGSSTKDVINLTLSNNKKINAGTYTANVTGLSNNNYTLPSTNLTRTWQIKQVELKGLWSTMNDFVYDGTTHVLYLTVTGFINSSDSSAVTSSSFTSSRNYTVSSSSSNSVILEFNIKDAGKYSHTISSFNNQNYIINEEMKKEVEVTQKVLNISWSGASTYTYNGTNQGVYMYVSGIASSDLKLFEDYILVKGSSYLCTTEDDNLKFYFYDKNAGTYTASIDSVTNSNYKLPSINLSKSWQIKQAELNSSWSAMDNFVYDGTNHTLYLTIAGFVNNTDTSAITTSSFTSSMIYTIESKSSNEIVLKFNIKNVGEYSYSITAFNNSNYKLNAVSTKVVEVTPKEVTISWNESNSYTYNGTSQGINMYLSGIASNDISSFKNYLSLTGNCTNSYDITTNTNGINYYFYATNAGTYSITVKANSDLTNYKFITQNKSFTINKKTLTSNWVSSTESWSDVYDGQINTISLVITGFVNGEKYTSSSFSSSTSISSYDNTVSGTLKLNFNVKDSGSYTFKVDSFSNNNYTFTSTSKTYTINPKALTVIWSGSSDVYSGLSQGYNLQITGIINSDCNSVKESLVYSGNISPKISSSLNSITYSFAAINAGTYSVNVKANSTLKNYTITSTSKTFEIEKRNIEVDVNSLKNGIITFTNLISGETINYDLNVYADENYTESISDWNYDGIYYYQINLVGADNYNLTNNSGSFKVGES